MIAAGDRPLDRGASCPDGVCLTCSDQAVAATVLRLLPDELAEVDAAGEAGATEVVSVALVGAAVGDVVLLHAGEAIAVVGR